MLKQDAGPKDVVFSNARTGMNIDSIKTGWRNACADAGLVNLRFHDTRHTFATRLRANGVHEWDIRDLLGHTSVRMTSVYTHQTPANLCQAVSTLESSKLATVVNLNGEVDDFLNRRAVRSEKFLAPEEPNVYRSVFRSGHRSFTSDISDRWMRHCTPKGVSELAGRLRL